jgi:hypothetical protein
MRLLTHLAGVLILLLEASGLALTLSVRTDLSSKQNWLGIRRYSAAYR